MPKNPLKALLRVILILTTAATGTLATSSCAHRPSIAQTETPWLQIDQDPRTLEDSDIELVYIFGHDRHQFRAEARKQKIRAQTYVDKAILREGTLEAARYQSIMKRVAALTANQGPSDPIGHIKSGNRPSCRAPFLARARVGTSTYLMNGCRHTDPGIQFGKIVRDAEFLLIAPRIPSQSPETQRSSGVQ